MLTSFSYPRFRWLWFSNLAGAAGRWTLVLVLSLQLLQMTNSSFWGFDRRTLNLVSSLVSAAVTGMFGFLSWARIDSLALWMALALLFGLSFVAQMTIRATLTPSMVPPDKLLNATSLVQVGLQGAQFAGPLIATPILAAGGPAAAWAFCSLLYLVSAALCARIGEVRGGGRREDAGFGLTVAYRHLRSRGAAWVAVWAVALHCMLRCPTWACCRCSWRWTCTPGRQARVRSSPPSGSGP